VTPELSVVIPVYNEAPNLETLCHELTESLDRAALSYEVIFVDDGSTDDSFDILHAVHKRDPRIGVIQLRRNFGQTAAFAAGFAAARGGIIVTSDGDLQNDPRDIPGLVARLGEGYDIVCGWRKERKDAWLSRRLPSFFANRLISWATGVRLNDYGCSLKVFRAEVVKPLRLYGEMHRFLPALASEVGVRIDEQPVNHRARVHGRSKYGISRTIRVILDLLTVKFLLSYSTRPLQMFGLIGFLMGALGIGVLAYLAGVKYLGHEAIGNRPLLMMGILLVFTGVQLVTSGLIAELIARTYHESQDKPVFVIRRVLSAAETSPLRDTRSTAAR
jgi:glycosyltransferase involved in cell wall biosynthesis